jgi:hypothetical protein
MPRPVLSCSKYRKMMRFNLLLAFSTFSQQVLIDQDESVDELILLNTVLMAISCYHFTSLRKMNWRLNHRDFARLNFDELSDDICMIRYRFTKHDIETIAHCMHIPLTWQDSHTKQKISGIEGLCLLLRRLSYPNRLADLVCEFGLDEPSMSRMIRTVRSEKCAIFFDSIVGLSACSLTTLFISLLGCCIYPT